MSQKHKPLAVAGLGALVIAAAFMAGCQQQADAKPSVDVRAPLVLNDADRHLVLDEMRKFLGVLQQITDALPREDMKTVAQAARTMGSGAANEIPPATVALLPDPFKLLAGEVHTMFDLIAMDAEAMGDPKHTVSQIGEMLQKCNACHGMYQVQLKK